MQSRSAAYIKYNQLQCNKSNVDWCYVQLAPSLRRPEEKRNIKKKQIRRCYVDCRNKVAAGGGSHFPTRPWPSIHVVHIFPFPTTSLLFNLAGIARAPRGIFFPSSCVCVACVRVASSCSLHLGWRRRFAIKKTELAGANRRKGRPSVLH